MVCLFTKPEKNSVTNWESLWRSHCILPTTVTNSEFFSAHTIKKFYGYGKKKLKSIYASPRLTALQILD